MVNAIVLLKAERDKVNDVAKALVDLKGVSEVYSVSGRYDLVAIIRVKDNDRLAETVTNQMKYNELAQQYDIETDHGRKQSASARWNEMSTPPPAR